MRNILLSILLLLPWTLISQDFQGQAIYKFNNSYADVDWSKKKLSASESAMLKSRLSEASRKTFELSFTIQESSWAEVEMLSVNAKGRKAKAGWAEATDKLLYKNLADQTYALETEVFDKKFLVSGTLELPQWELTDETKKIGTYKVQKAIYRVEEKVLAFGKDEMVTKSSEVEAWFTMDIPISSGPSYYWGLPGLILEVKNGATSYICERISLNTGAELVINKPTKGEKVSNEELEEIIQQKTEEMYKKYNKKGK